ncbi:MAG: FKBP-type peptidyl-prolyl cis-trans isomerase [Bacteroidia bacterium]|nr:FKBP-type peptidyl-prolyl cis-trans isomerase [Bacteroidia bacterium]MCZ2277183.1 FKBP-type peptidyl-prolyl cis-trans isomerase [Bacteroidia bacterium]
MLVLSACSSCIHNQENDQQATPAEMKERLIRANRIFVKNQLDDIDGYIATNELKTDSTQTGLRYFINRTGESGKRASVQDIAGIRYKVQLLDGRDCYTADSSLYREFDLSQDDIPSGLREGILMMNEGDKAMFIIPSHLAFGLTGDGDCIPPNAALIINVKLEKVIQP